MNLTPEQRAIPPNFNYDSFTIPENATITGRLAPHNDASFLSPREELSEEFRTIDGAVIELSKDMSVSIEHGRAIDPENLLKRISAGQYKAYKRIQEVTPPHENGEDEWLVGVAHSLYDSRLPITTVDVSANDLDVIAFVNATGALDRVSLTSYDPDELQGIMIKRYSLLQKRDQRILQNLAPALENLIVDNKRLAAARELRPLNFSVLYGSVHRSLFDAMMHKVEEEPVRGAKIMINPDNKEHIDEELYARYLRGMPIPGRSIVGWIAMGKIDKRFRLSARLPASTAVRLAETIVAENELHDFDDVRALLGRLQSDKRVAIP